MFNPLLELARWLQDTSLRLDLSQSTWGVPIIGAIHVLAIAWFGGAVFVRDLVRDPRGDNVLRRFRWTGLSILWITGALLFWSQPLRLYYSQFFRLKMLLLAAIGLSAALPTRHARWAMVLSLALWAAVIFASRGIAYR